MKCEYYYRSSSTASTSEAFYLEYYVRTYKVELRLLESTAVQLKYYFRRVL